MYLHEEDWSVVSDHVPVTLLSVELDGESTGIAGSICGTLLTSDSREASEERGALANAVQELGLGVLADVVGDLEVTMGTSTLGMDDTLGNALAVKVRKLVNESEILEQTTMDRHGGWVLESHTVLACAEGPCRGKIIPN
jgi:hypothetical protein